jgi:DNA invertase Pin-like site-specific DNA recombinase
MLIGYARTSTADQVAGVDDQKGELEKAGVERIYAEHVSAVAKTRPQFDIVMSMLRAGDVLVVTKLDRLARSMLDLMQIIGRVKAAGASLRVLAMGLDTSNATGKLMLNVLGSVAEFERELMLERQRVGIAKARVEGKYKGRKRTFSDERLAVLRWPGNSASVAKPSTNESKLKRS